MRITETTKNIITRCDKCGKPEASRYSITPPTQPTSRVDLCAEHAAPLVELAALGKQPKRRRVHSLEEVEAARIKERKGK